MKVKTLVALAASGLLAVSFAHAAPAALNTQLVDDATGTQSAAPNDMNANVGTMDSNSAGNPGAASSADGNPMGDQNVADAGNDENTQDTATGDSDY